MIKAAAETFEILPQEGCVARAWLNPQVELIAGPIKSSLVLLDDGRAPVVLLTTHFIAHNYPLTNLYRSRVAERLGLPRDRVLMFSSHNHCVPDMMQSFRAKWGDDNREVEALESELSREGTALLDNYLRVASYIRERLEPVKVHYGSREERRITHNRKGRRADGTSFLMREEDRLQQGVDYCGDIDAEAGLVALLRSDGSPVCFLAHFTGHPVTAYHPEYPIVFGEFPQVACDRLSAKFRDVPVAFLQGCAGDTNSKGLMSLKQIDEKIREAEGYGLLLGDTFIEIADDLRPSPRDELVLRWRRVGLPFDSMPGAEVLERRLREVESFMARCDAGDEAGTRICDGLNYPRNMSPAFRKNNISKTARWLMWALKLHREKRLDQIPAGVALDIATLRIGSVGLAGFPCEPFLGIGRKVRRQSPLDLTLPCGYMNDTMFVGYVPDAANCDGTEYMSSFYRFTTSMLPYRAPAGDSLAEAAVEMLGCDMETAPAAQS